MTEDAGFLTNSWRLSTIQCYKSICSGKEECLKKLQKPQRQIKYDIHLYKMYGRIVLATIVLCLFLLRAADCRASDGRLMKADGYAESEGDEKKTCQDGMNMVKLYLETSKIELIKNIRAAKSIQCKMQAWRKVVPSMISNMHMYGVSVDKKTDATGGLKIVGKVQDGGCKAESKGTKGSSMIAHIKGDWNQIMYTQVFKGSCKCWSIFGAFSEMNPLVTPGLESFNPTMGDVIFGQKKMKSSTDDVFSGLDGGCNGFWSRENGEGERQATVILRRKKGAKHAGIHTRTFCGTPEYEIKDIFVLM